MNIFIYIGTFETVSHYSTVIQPEVLYASKCLTISRRGLTEKLEVRKLNILRKTLDPIKKNNEYRRRLVERDNYFHMTY